MSSEQVNVIGLENGSVHQVDRCPTKSGKTVNNDKTANGDDSSIYSRQTTSSIIQLNNLFLNLRSSTRDSLISVLVQFSSLISGEATEGKDKLLEVNKGLIEQLSNLRLRLDEHDERPRKRVKREEESDGQRELIFALDWNTKSRIISLLLANKNFAFLSKTNSSTIRSNLVKQNDTMIRTLLALKIDSMQELTIANGSNNEEMESETETATGTTNDNVEATNQLMMKKFDDRIFALEIQLKNNICNLREEMRKSIEQIRTELDFSRPEIKFTWDLKEFSKLSASKVYRSNWFYVRNVPWYLFARCDQFLDLFLCIQNNIGCYKWLCKVEFNLRILNQSGKGNIVIQNKHTFMRNEGFGSVKIVLLDDLVKNGFVKDDTLKLQVKLKAGEIVKM